jgi:membrane-bound lytic murein transglycosylase A
MIENSGKDYPLTKLEKDAYPDFFDDLRCKDLAKGIVKSIEYFNRVPKKRFFRFGNTGFTAEHLKKSLVSFLYFIQKKPGRAEFQDYVKENYFVFKSRGSKLHGNVLFTGYYEPVLNGSLSRTEKFRFPVYSAPSNIIYLDISKFYPDLPKKRITGRIEKNRFLPYYTREELNKKQILAEYSKPIAWVESKIDLFFLEIQGSGVIKFTDGGELKVHYHSSNGHSYRSIGKYLVDKGKIAKEGISMQSIRRYLSENPDEMESIFNYNPSFVFFQTEKGGPYGSIGVELSPKRSIATDPRTFPKGALCFIKTQEPVISDGKIIDWVDFGRFVLNQDTGGAIKGAGRVDIFMGNGVEAEITAGHMQHRGDLFFLVLKPE